MADGEAELNLVSDILLYLYSNRTFPEKQDIINEMLANPNAS